MPAAFKLPSRKEQVASHYISKKGTLKENIYLNSCTEVYLNLQEKQSSNNNYYYYLKL